MNITGWISPNTEGNLFPCRSQEYGNRTSTSNRYSQPGLVILIKSTVAFLPHGNAFVYWLTRHGRIRQVTGTFQTTTFSKWDYTWDAFVVNVDVLFPWTKGQVGYVVAVCVYVAFDGYIALAPFIVQSMWLYTGFREYCVDNGVVMTWAFPLTMRISSKTSGQHHKKAQKLHLKESVEMYIDYIKISPIKITNNIKIQYYQNENILSWYIMNNGKIYILAEVNVIIQPKKKWKEIFPLNNVCVICVLGKCYSHSIKRDFK